VDDFRGELWINNFFDNSGCKFRMTLIFYEPLLFLIKDYQVEILITESGQLDSLLYDAPLPLAEGLLLLPRVFDFLSGVVSTSSLLFHFIRDLSLKLNYIRSI